MYLIKIQTKISFSTNIKTKISNIGDVDLYQRAVVTNDGRFFTQSQVQQKVAQCLFFRSYCRIVPQFVTYYLLCSTLSSNDILVD